MKKKFIYSLILIIGLLVVGSVNVHAQTSNYRYQAIFVSSFIKQIQWPSNNQTGEFVIGIMGNRQVANVMSDKLSRQKAKGREIVVKNFTSYNNIESCDLIFIPATTRTNFNTLNAKVGDKPSLIITEKEGMI